MTEKNEENNVANYKMLTNDRCQEMMMIKVTIMLKTVQRLGNPATSALTFEVTASEFSWKFMMASEILTSNGSMTLSILKGPSNRSATFSMASIYTMCKKNNSTIHRVSRTHGSNSEYTETQI